MNQGRADTQQQFSALIEESYDYVRPKRGEFREAVILSVRKNEIFVDLGFKRDGVIPRQDLDKLDQKYRESLQAGVQVPVCVTEVLDRGDGITVSLKQGLEEWDWKEAREMLESGEMSDAEVVDINQGGVLVAFGHLRGFVPNSHLTSIRQGLSRDRLEEAKSKLIGQTLSLTVIEANRQNHRFVLSERAAGRHKRQRLLEGMEEGDVRDGVVSNVVNFGVFVDLGGVDGLIHISELDWRHIDHPGDVLKVGEEMKVQVLSVDKERERIALSRKRLLPDPWPVVTESLETDQIIEGTVTKVVEFGAFVDIGEGVEGLLHKSEMPGGDGTCAELKPNGKIQVRVLEIDPRQRRIALSLKDVSAKEPTRANTGTRDL
jgi:small subunit ribosomal protein S1